MGDVFYHWVIDSEVSDRRACGATTDAALKGLDTWGIDCEACLAVLEAKCRCGHELWAHGHPFGPDRRRACTEEVYMVDGWDICPCTTYEAKGEG